MTELKMKTWSINDSRIIMAGVTMQKLRICMVKGFASVGSFSLRKVMYGIIEAKYGDS